MSMEFDTNKQTSERTPFYHVHRDETGIVMSCVRESKWTCNHCIFTKCCYCRDKEETI